MDIVPKRVKERIVMRHWECMSKNNYIHCIARHNMSLNRISDKLKLFSQIVIEPLSIYNSTTKNRESKVQGPFVDKEKVFWIERVSLNLKVMVPLLVKLVESASPKVFGF